MADGVDALFQNADDPAWRDLMARAESHVEIKSKLEPDAYAALFQTPLGQAVLEDMYNRYVNVTRAIPGEGSDAAFYREGMAQVVFDIVNRINRANEGKAK